ncbi:hypothetical protein AN4846.2 [Aspergillus nidulans FGSC A4]|uniref:Mid2 domain-containing protein n=1 Tax=Emericella nidulans (strain FGSC A4 / ATCC 38163 / CBS 112.46 / NRRL 194 / M139) TaxID=227321 RepID=Q5B3N4_EMENI|nr:hypothetical protein [Aspergillus nidulans FGSC A4]EAA60081.1 hypothetical protein AN4846.2 [Aspergillus nidulans FGSC A4]CBF76644.1 TPA: conserved hypothetical protein [Aspergillus nidulans FGSC A4]|eukprot:XP_662450.1 hypothetical protein AN4846.2 [Aspergillus nidulans FGSC A4]
MFFSRFILHSTLLSVTIAAKCYYTDGTFALDEQQPCFPEKEHSACCGIAKTNGDENDYCLTNGLCLGQVKGYTGFVLLNSCTDSSWESDDCPNFCPKSMQASYGIHILPCLENSNNQWCCSTDGSDCCDNAFELDMGKLMYPGPGGNWTNPTSVINPPTSTYASTTSSAGDNASQIATTTVTVTSDPDSGSNSSSSETCDNGTGTCQDSKTTIVGVGVGLGVALVVCLASSAAALCFQRRQFNRRLEETKASYLASGYLPAPRAQAELYASNARPPIAELPANKRTSIFEM